MKSYFSIAVIALLG